MSFNLCFDMRDQPEPETILPLHRARDSTLFLAMVFLICCH
jgi:hypothetical protein